MLGHTAFVNDISFSQDSQLLVSVSHDQMIRLWNIKGDLVKILGGHNSPVYSVGFHPSDLFFASGDADGKIKLWSKDGKLLDTINIGSSVDKVKFSPDGTILAVATRGQVSLIDLNLSTLINKGCDRIRNYLKNNPNVRESDRQLCQ